MTDTHDNEIIRWELDTDRREPVAAIAEVVADLEGTPVDELPPIYDCTGGILSELFLNSPAPEAQMAVEFTYCGYRITVEQSGGAELVHIT